MFAIPPLLLLAVAVVLVAAMRHGPHPNHRFLVELLQRHLQDESELSGDPPQGTEM
jgi:hypothetical protein